MGCCGPKAPAKPQADRLTPTTTRLVADNAALHDLCDKLADAPTLVVDTEFHAERRYAPELLLVQLGTPDDGTVWVVDATSVDLAGLHAVLDQKVWLAHGASQDIAILHRVLGVCPSRLLDTQILGALTGLSFPARLDHLCESVLGTAPDKSSSLSDWAQRPLSATQLAYAASDVAVLPPLWRALHAQLLELGPERVDWAHAAGDERIAQSTAPPDPDRHWQSMRIAHTFDGPTRQLLHDLHTWREGIARDQNRPPHYILSNPHILDLARRRPRSPGEIAQNRRISDRTIQRFGDRLASIIRNSLKGPVSTPPVPGPALRRRSTLIGLWAEFVAQQHNIAAPLLLPERLCAALAQGSTELLGWRVAILAAEVEQLLSGRISMALGSNGDIEPHTD